MGGGFLTINTMELATGFEKLGIYLTFLMTNFFLN